MKLSDIQLKSISSDELSILANEALAELERRTDETRSERWNELIDNIQSYINDYGEIIINVNGYETTLTLADFSFTNAIIIETEDD